jgi:hypothetical protein
MPLAEFRAEALRGCSRLSLSIMTPLTSLPFIISSWTLANLLVIATGDLLYGAIISRIAAMAVP